MSTTCPVIEDYPSFLPGGFAPCCFPVMDPVNVSPEEFFYGEAMDELRRQHRNGTPPEICKNCVLVNSVTGFRQHTSRTFKTKLDFETISISRSSKCNRACRMCKPNLSSTLSKLEGLSPKPIENDYLIDVVKKHRKTIRNVFVGGGNPYQDKGTWEAIALLDPANIEIINVTSNGSIVLDEHIEILSRFKHVMIAFSIDGDKVYNEGMRTLTNQEKLYELIRSTEQRIKQYPTVNICIQPTATNVSIQRFRELYDEIEANVEDISKFYYSDNVCFFPEIYAPWNLSEEKRVEVREKLAADAAYLIRKKTPFADRMVSDIIKCEKLMRVKPANPELLEQFRLETIRHDKLAGANFIEIQNVL